MKAKIYDKIFGEYVKDLQEARAATEYWWDTLMASEVRRLGDTASANSAVRTRWPMGPSSHPYVVHVYRHYYLRIEDVNAQIRAAWRKRDSAQPTSVINDPGWGVEDRSIPETTIEPEYIVWERLEREEPELSEYLQPLVLVEPIGFDFGASPTWDAVTSTRPPIAGLIAHNVQKGITRLLTAPRDITQSWPRPSITIPKDQAPGEHLRLFNAYTADLSRVLNEAVYSWSYKVREIQDGQQVSQKQAVNIAYNDSVGGPASSRYVIWCVRKYWLDCEALNKTLPKERWVAPEMFMVGWLRNDVYNEHLELLSQLPYWPVGLNKQGEWV